MSQPLVSILLPTHNRPEVLACAIASVLQQSYTNFELQIVGDGCSESTEAVVRSFSDDRILWYDRPKGPGFGYANRNFALRQSQGECIAYMTHDDLWLPDHLYSCVEALQSQEIDLVYTRPLWVADDGVIFPIPFNLESPSTRASFTSFKTSAIASSTILHRKSCFDAVGLWDDTLQKNGDWDLWVRILSLRPKNVRMINMYSTLHFHAIWKESGDLPTHYQVWRNFYGQLGTDLPPLLAMPLPADKPPQHIYWHLLHQSPSTFTEDLRSGLAQVCELWFDATVQQNLRNLRLSGVNSVK